MFEHEEPPPQMEEVEVIVKKPLRGGNFNMDEDNMLISSWIEITMDAVQGNEQKHKKYRGGNWEYFHGHKTFNSNRNPNSLVNRWFVIQQAVNKFCGYLAQVELRPQRYVLIVTTYQYFWNMFYLFQKILIRLNFVIFFKLGRQNSCITSFKGQHFSLNIVGYC